MYRKVIPTHCGQGTSSESEVDVNIDPLNLDGNEVGWYIDHQMEIMLNDAFRYEENSPIMGRNVQTDAFYNMMQSAQQALYEGCTTHNELSAIMSLLSIKSEHNISNQCFNDVVHNPNSKLNSIRF